MLVMKMMMLVGNEENIAVTTDQFLNLNLNLHSVTL